MLIFRSTASDNIVCRIPAILNYWHVQMIWAGLAVTSQMEKLDF